MPAKVAATGLWRSVSSTNSSRSAPNAFMVSIIGLHRVRPKAPALPARRPSSSRGGSLSADPRYVGCLLAPGAGHDVELHAVALGQRPESIRLNRREVHEHFLAIVVADEAEALGLVE